MTLKRLLSIALVLTCILATLASCGPAKEDETAPTETQAEETQDTETTNSTEELAPEEENQITTPAAELKNLGQNLESAGINNGKFEGETTKQDFKVTYISGTENAYTYDEEKNSLTFSSLSADSVYSISGKLNGNIILDVGEAYKLELVLDNFSLRSSSTNPILITSAKETVISTKKDTKNYIYDERAVIDDSAENAYSGSIHSTSNLTVCGGGELFVQSANNRGILSNTDLFVKELALVVECNDKALSGKANVTIENCSTLLVAKSGDAIKTEATNIIKDTENHNGTISILGGTHNIFASNDGIEASYDAIVDYGSYVDADTNETKTVATVLNIFTDKYSTYTSTTAHEKPDLETRVLYVCHTNKDYKYSVKLFNADESKSEWVNPTFHENVSNGRRTYYTHRFYANPEYTKMQLFVYSKDQTQQNEEKYESKSAIIDIDKKSDTYRYSNRRWQWQAYSSLTGGNNSNANANANPNALDYSAKGIRATNSVTVKAGVINISSADNAINANNQASLESGKTPAGNIVINGGDITVTTLCNGLNSNGALTINGGNVKIAEAFEGIKGNTVKIVDGDISVISTNNGISASAKSETGITFDGGKIYVYAGANGIHANSSASYTAILFNGGNIVIIAPETGKSAIYSDGGYTYKDGLVLAILNKDGNRSSTTQYHSFSHIGKIQELELVEKNFVSAEIDGSALLSAKIPKSFSATVVFLGYKAVVISAYENIEATADANGVYWGE